MGRKLLLALAASAALAVAGSAHATEYIGFAEGVFTSGVPLGHSADWTGPEIAAGDAFRVDFTFDDAKCDLVGGNCYGGNASPGPLNERPATATIVTDGWTRAILGTDFQFDSLTGLHLEDADMTLVFDEQSGHLAWDEPGGFRLDFAVTTFDPEAIPEPALWATMIVGLFALGAMLRRQRHGLLA